MVERDLTAPSSLARAARVAGWGLTLWAGLQVVGAVWERRPMAAAVAQAALAEWGCGRMGMAWSDPLRPPPKVADISKRVAWGMGFGCGAAVVAIAVAVVAGHASLAGAPGAPHWGLLVVGGVSSVLAAVRDELVLRGVVLRATRGLLPAWACVLACGAAAGAARFGADGEVGPWIAVEALRGVSLGALWVRDRGVWLAWATNASWLWSMGCWTRGALTDVRFATDNAAAIDIAGVLVVAAAISLFSLSQRRDPTSDAGAPLAPR